MCEQHRTSLWEDWWEEHKVQELWERACLGLVATMDCGLLKKSAVIATLRMWCYAFFWRMMRSVVKSVSECFSFCSIDKQVYDCKCEKKAREMLNQCVQHERSWKIWEKKSMKTPAGKLHAALFLYSAYVWFVIWLFMKLWMKLCKVLFVHQFCLLTYWIMRKTFVSHWQKRQEKVLSKWNYLWMSRFQKLIDFFFCVPSFISGVQC